MDVQQEAEQAWRETGTIYDGLVQADRPAFLAGYKAAAASRAAAELAAVLAYEENASLRSQLEEAESRDIGMLVERIRERSGRLIIGTGFDGEYRVEADYPGGAAVSNPNLYEALKRLAAQDEEKR